MKKDIHPVYYSEAKIICSCGNTIITGSTKKEMKIEVCSACHPFYTGKKRLVDSTGRLDRFKKRSEKTVQIQAEKIAKEKAEKKPSAVKAEKIVKKKVAVKKAVAKNVVTKKPAVKKAPAKAKKK